MTFAQRRNRLKTHYSLRIPVVKRRLSVYKVPNRGQQLECKHQRHCSLALGTKVRGCRTCGPVTELASQGDRCWTAADLNVCIQITAVMRVR